LNQSCARTTCRTVFTQPRSEADFAGRAAARVYVAVCAMARRVILRRRNNSVAFEAKRTFSELRLDFRFNRWGGTGEQYRSTRFKPTLPSQSLA
jgi:hypothetical protein